MKSKRPVYETQEKLCLLLDELSEAEIILLFDINIYDIAVDGIFLNAYEEEDLNKLYNKARKIIAKNKKKIL